MAYDDVGLQVRFSTLQFASLDSTRYQYRLSGTQDITYPSTPDPQVYFPKLEPGAYVFSVSAIGMSGGKESPSAQIKPSNDI